MAVNQYFKMSKYGYVVKREPQASLEKSYINSVGNLTIIPDT